MLASTQGSFCMSIIPIYTIPPFLSCLYEFIFPENLMCNCRLKINKEGKRKIWIPFVCRTTEHCRYFQPISQGYIHNILLSSLYTWFKFMCTILIGWTAGKQQRIFPRLEKEIVGRFWYTESIAFQISMICTSAGLRVLFVLRTDWPQSSSSTIVGQNYAALLHSS